jgi:hypothetical protein
MRRFAVLACSALCFVALGLTAGAGQASADQLPLYWPITGNTVIAKPKLTTTIPAGASFTGTLETSDLTMKGDTRIPDLTVHMTLLGFIPTTSVVRLVPTAPTTAKIDVPAGKVTATTKFRMEVLRVSSDWLPSVNLVPSGCRTSKESVATLRNTTPPNFLYMRMAGTFSIPSFTHCGLSTPLLTALLSGGGNKMTLDFGAPPA